MKNRNGIFSKSVIMAIVIAFIIGILSGCNIPKIKEINGMFNMGLTFEKDEAAYKSALTTKVTREKAFSVILNITGLVMDNAGLSDNNLDSVLNNYADGSKVSADCKRNVAIASKMNLFVENNEQTIKPDKLITGSEIKYAIYAALGFNPDENNIDNLFYKTVKLPDNLKNALKKNEINGKDFYDICYYVLLSKNEKEEFIGEKLVYQLAVDESVAIKNGIINSLYIKRIDNKLTDINAVALSGINEYNYLNKLLTQLDEYVLLSKNTDSSSIKNKTASAKKVIKNKNNEMAKFIAAAKKVSLTDSEISGIKIMDRIVTADKIVKKSATAVKSNNVITLENAYSKYVFNITDHISFVSLFNNELNKEMLTGYSNGSLISLDIGGTIYTEKDLIIKNTVISQTETAVMTAVLQTIGEKKLEITIKVTLNDGPEALFDIKIKNLSGDAVEVIPNFPNIKGLTVNSDLNKNWYLYPRKGGVINNTNIAFSSYASSMYGSGVTFPIMDIYDQAAGGGLYMLVKGDQLQEKFLLFEKSNNGIDMSIKYFESNIADNNEWTGATVALGVHSGDWYNAIDAYKQYLATWFKPAAQIDSLNDVVQVETVYSTMPSVKNKIFAGKDPSSKVKGIFDEAETKYSGFQMLHWFDWWTNLGDYLFNTSYGGVNEIKKVANNIHDLNKRFSLYTEGILANNSSKIATDTKNNIFRLNKEGQLYVNNNAYDITCTDSAIWQDHYANRLFEIAKSVPVDNIYMDQIGNHNEVACYNASHNHTDPYCGLMGQSNLVKRLREGYDKIRPGISFGGEYAVTDYMSQYMSYVYNYNCCKWYVGLDGLKIDPIIDLYSFIFTNVRQYSIVIKPGGEDYIEDIESLKLVFFNGYGRCNYVNEDSEFIKTSMGILKSFSDVFYSDNKVPLLNTGIKDFYVNKFSSDNNEKTIYTLFNKSKQTINKIVLNIENPDNYIYFDLWTNKQLTPLKSSNDVELDINLLSGDVGAVAVIKK